MGALGISSVRSVGLHCLRVLLGVYQLTLSSVTGDPENKMVKYIYAGSKASWAVMSAGADKDKKYQRHDPQALISGKAVKRHVRGPL